MKFLKSIFVIAMVVGLAGIWSCDDDSDPDPTIAGTWVLTQATADGTTVSPATMTVSLSVTDADGNGTFTISNITGDIVAFNGQNSGTYTLSGTNAITFTTNGESNVAQISSSPLSGGAGADWVVTFTANLEQHNDKNGTEYRYTFQLQ